VSINGFDVQGINVPTWISTNGAHDGANFQNGIASQSSYVSFINNISHDNGGSGIGTAFDDHVTIEGNVIYGNARTGSNAYSGISIYQAQSVDASPGNHIIIAGNVVYGNGEVNTTRATHTDGNGIIIDDFQNTQNSGRSIFKDFPYPTIVENNLVFANGGRGIHINESDNVMVRNNTVFDNNLDPLLTSRGELTAGMAAGPATNDIFVNNIAIANPTIPTNGVAYELTKTGKNDPGVVWSHNLLAFDSPSSTAFFYQPKNDYLATAITLANGNLLGYPPGFVDPANYDFTLVTGSPAVGAGTPNYGIPSTDLAGTSRLPIPVDLGAYAYRRH
jgi:serralysin